MASLPPPLNLFPPKSIFLESGGIWMLDMRDAEAEPVKLQIQGYPEQPLHGMFVFLALLIYFIMFYLSVAQLTFF